jgi:putative transposase
MPRKILPISNELPYFITTRSNNKEWFALEPQACWDVFCDFLYFIHHAFQVRTHAFVLMSNHIHLLATFPRENIGFVMRRFLTEVSQSINFESYRINHVFGGRYKGSLIQTDIGYAAATKYLFRNPVKAGIVARVEDYRFSSLRTYFGLDHSVVPQFLDDYGLVPNEPSRFLAWLNEDFEQDSYESIRKAIMRPVFEPRAKGTSKKKFRLDI